MNLPRPLESVVVRLAACLVVGGLLVSIAITTLAFSRGRERVQADLNQQTILTARNLQGVLRGMLDERDADTMEAVLSVFVVEQTHLRAARLTVPGMAPVVVGRWDDGVGEASGVWTINELGVVRGEDIGLEKLSFVKAPFTHDQRQVSLDLLVDGPEVVRAMQAQTYRGLHTLWLFLAVLTLLGLLLTRRWFTSPLREVIELIGMRAGAGPFRRLAKRHVGEFAQLDGAIAQMLERIDETSRRLSEREQAFASLYDQAPAALLSLDLSGRVIEANRRAVELLGVSADEELVGRAAAGFAVSEDRPLLEQTIERLAFQELARCELRVEAAGRRIECTVEAMGDRDHDGVLRSVRLAITDVSRSKALQRELEDQGRLLNLLIDHMSDAILLVDASGRVAACNQQLANLLNLRAGAVQGARFDHADFWDALGVLNKETFVGRLRQIDAEMERPAQERFETRSGVFLVQGVPVRDGGGVPVGRLWVLRETTPQEHSQRLLKQQNHQLRVLKEIGAALQNAFTIDALMQQALEQLFQGTEIEAAGIAVRTPDAQRCRQLIHRGSGAYLLETNRALVDAVQRRLMPQVLGARDVAFWTDLQIKTPWAEALRTAGLTCIACAPMRGSSDAQGIIWVARRGGERLERHQIVMLESIAPLLAARLQLALLAENMQAADLTDPVTGLPNIEQSDVMLHRAARKIDAHLGVLVVHVDHFDRINEMYDRAEGDRMLKRVADQLLATCRRSTFVSRISGPNFVMVDPASDPAALMHLAERVRSEVTGLRLTSPSGDRYRLTCSIGLASCPEDGHTPFDARDAAMIRLELAKQAGRDRIVATGPGSARAAG